MQASEVTREVRERANQLYWSSDSSVNQIADDLELSKGALYGIIEPEPAGLACPMCGDEVVYSNRTAKAREMLDCPTCEWDGAPEEAAGPLEPARRPDSDGKDVTPSGTSRDDIRAGERSDAAPAAERVPPRPFVRPSVSTIAGGALLGAAAGLALVMWARRR